MVGTNGWDVLTFGVPSTIAAAGALFAAYWARGARTQAQSAKDEVKSPNGGTTGGAVEQIRRDLSDLRGRQTEFQESVRASRMLTADVRTEVRDARDGVTLQIRELGEAQRRAHGETLSMLDAMEQRVARLEMHNGLHEEPDG